MARNRLRLLFTLLLALGVVALWSSPYEQLYYLLRMPVVWKSSTVDTVLSQQQDQFDLTFSSYPANYSTVDAGYTALIPPLLHHIHLGSRPPRQAWLDARRECLKYHESWNATVWTDENADALVRNDYPHLYTMWKSYPYPIQRVDALRYMILQKYGGVLLDYDLACKRSLEPLRRFDFVAPAAHPAGYSIGMMLSSPNSTYIKALVNNLSAYNHRWAFLPYVTVMFSTGCHYASTIYTLQSNRTNFRILAGPADQPRMHMLNGLVNTPLFRHLGSSSWHDRDAHLISLFKNMNLRALLVVMVMIMFGTAALVMFYASRRGRAQDSDEERQANASKSA
ncbi:putative glycosyl transferase [Aspergillus clavatus NRRL 1]|uniref:Glycosyl transferase, putative n=1 Tax=Aspergillus clavatus (strain ATCC 1007 / CBS 513.65 / DSM 816 / NCTC 3887 / NRRL 1 / QM 1276 / 107) TaxID=344612 RepID=A1C8L4_ASPCL|nr:glycosyl transferase, putative [Aspergillus clavatus NRRL 1]EAW13651.1 glycosyl transferase, putative [Aspergillus clavatus NRRL 1]